MINIKVEHELIDFSIILGLLDLIIFKTHLLKTYWYNVANQFIIITLINVAFIGLIYYYLTSAIKIKYQKKLKWPIYYTPFLDRLNIINLNCLFTLISIVIYFCIGFSFSGGFVNNSKIELLSFDATINIILLDAFMIINVFRIKSLLKKKLIKNLN